MIQGAICTNGRGTFSDKALDSSYKCTPYTQEVTYYINSNEVSPKPYDTGMVYEVLDKALAITDIEVRLFGKLEDFTHRRMGVALATAENVDVARSRAVKE